MRKILLFLNMIFLFYLVLWDEDFGLNLSAYLGLYSLSSSVPTAFIRKSVATLPEWNIQRPRVHTTIN